MIPPHQINVLDAHGGFTALTKSPCHEKVCTAGGVFLEWKKVYKECNSLWRPGALLKDPTGDLQEYDENSFFQNNDNITKAIYKVKGYGNRIAVWFDNTTGVRIA